MKVVDLRGAVVLLGRFPALSGLDLTIEKGETVLLQGPNGAGKSTLLRLTAGLLHLESGSGEVLGLDIETRSRDIRRRVGLLGHTSGLYDDLTTLENVTFWAEAAGVERTDATAALDRVGIAERLHDLPVRNLSAGQRRRTAIASVIVKRPELWLLDEPHAGLDQTGRDVVDALVGDAVRAGATVILASHELDRVRSLAPRVVTIAGGRVHADRPADRADV